MISIARTARWCRPRWDSTSDPSAPALAGTAPSGPVADTQPIARLRRQGVMTAVRSLLVLALVALASSACSLFPGSSPDTRTESQREIALQAAKWELAGIDTYTFAITRSCFCPPEWSGPFQVTVEDGEATSVLYQGQPAAPYKITNVPLTIEAVFAALLVGDAGATLSATWEPTLGFPTSVSVDPIPNAIDDEFAITIEDFAASD